MSGRVSLVTGGTGALGQAVTLRLLAAGDVVCVPWVLEREYDALMARIPPEARERFWSAFCDVLDPSTLEILVDTVMTRYARIDALVTTVGGFAMGGLAATDRVAWEGMLSLNLTSVFLAARAVVPHMVDRGYGRVVTVASRAVVPPTGGFLGYKTKPTSSDWSKKTGIRSQRRKLRTSAGV